MKWIKIPIKVGHYYQSNWFTPQEPEWGFFHVIKRCTGREGGTRFSFQDDYMGYLIEEVNPWGGHWTHWREDTDLKTHIKGNLFEVPALLAQKYLLLGHGIPKGGR